MRRLAPVLLLALLASGCGNDTGIEGADSSPTPDEATPTPTPESGGDVYVLTPDSPQQYCAVGQIGVVWGAPTVELSVDGTSFTPGWSFGTATVLDAPSGTLNGDDFQATWAWCKNNGAYSERHDYSWSGTFSADRSTFTSTLYEVIYIRSEAALSNCGTMTDSPYGDCTVPGLTWSISGAVQ